MVPQAPPSIWTRDQILIREPPKNQALNSLSRLMHNKRVVSTPMSFDVTNSEKSCSFQPVTLDSMPKGARCIVTSVTSTDTALRNKLLAMGIVAGTVVEVSAVAPLGDPVTIKALGYSLSLRLSEASQVRVLPVSSQQSQ